MRGLGRTEKFEQTSQVTEPKVRAKGSRRSPKGTRLRRWGSHCEARRRAEKGIAEKLSTGTGNERMGDQAGGHGESRRSESESGALWMPLRGGSGKKGKEEAEAE